MFRAFTWGSKVNTSMTAREAFAAVDTDGSGSLSVAELKEALMKSGQGTKASVGAIKSLLKEMDMDGDGELNIEEFEQMWGLMQQQKSPSRFSVFGFGKKVTSKMSAREAFAAVDTDASGTLSLAELKAALTKAGSSEGLSDADLAAIVDEIDKDGNGMLDVNEFETLWNIIKAGEFSKGVASKSAAEGAVPSKSAEGVPPPSRATSRRPSVATPAQPPSRATARRSSVAAPAVAERAPKRLSEEALETWVAWIGRIGVAQVVMDALQLPPDDQEAFQYVRSLDRIKMAVLLDEAQLSGLLEPLMAGVDFLKGQAAASGRDLDKQFEQTAKFKMGYGTLDVFFGGLERLLGPPQMVKDPDKGNTPTIMKAMETEHTSADLPDTHKTFTSSNGVTTTSATEWEFVYSPDLKKHKAKEYPERKGFHGSIPNGVASRGRWTTCGPTWRSMPTCRYALWDTRR